jgi:nicotinamide-nucleotide adenylyltransferase
MSKPVGLFVGRFQPFHRGHLLVLQGMVKMCRKIYVIIGGHEAQDKDNPFTFPERKEMIQRALQEEDIIPLFDVEFVVIPDQESDEAWIKEVLEKTPGVEKVWTGNEWVERCFAGKGMEIQKIKEVPGISATEVRRLMKEGGDWEELLPDEVARYLKEIEGVKRVKALV